MNGIRAALGGILLRLRTLTSALWQRYKALPRFGKIGVVLTLIVLVIGGFVLLRSGTAEETKETMRSVSLKTVAELSGGGASGQVLGTVEARSEATLIVENSGNVVRVNAQVGSRVAPGTVLVELENAAERASLLQAQGAYDAAVASRAAVSPVDDDMTARSTYRTAFSEIDTALESSIDLFFGGQTPSGPDLLINPSGNDTNRLSRERNRIDTLMDAWRDSLASSDIRDPNTLLTEATDSLREITLFVEELAEAALKSDSRATDAQLAALGTARASLQATEASLTSARASYRSGQVGSTASVEAGVTSALGTLRLAEANLEKTRVRAPIGGTLNFLPVKVGDYIQAFTHVATVAENSALEVVASVSSEERTLLRVGMTLTIENDYTGVITSLAPALDPITKQIEVRLAVTDTTDLIHGQTVHVTLPGAASQDPVEGPLYLPLAAVKLRATDRVVFTVDAEGRLVAHPVTTGDVRGDVIVIDSPLDRSLRIVADARGLAEGERVNVAP